MPTHTLPLVLAALFLLGACGCDSKNQTDTRKQEQEERLARQTNFAAKYNAVVDWLDPKANGFTLELQNAFIRQDGRPILASVRLEDVGREAEDHVALFSSYSCSPFIEYRWLLSCTPEQAQALMRHGFRGIGPSCLIIARVSSVKRGLISQSREHSDGTSGVENEDVTLVRGQLVDWLDGQANASPPMLGK